MERQLVTARRISDLRPIEGADRIELAIVDGWQVVVKKGEYMRGDLAIYFEIDSAIPAEGVFSFLAERSPKKVVNGRTCHVVRTAKLRGAISQGLLMPPEELGLTTLSEGQDLTEWAKHKLRVTKYEKPLPADNGKTEGHFPTHIVRKTDSERVQNLTGNWEEIQEYIWVATEKIDGTSSTFAMTEEGLIVCSRNYAIKEGDNLYWNIARQYGLDTMPVGYVVQGEIYGEGIQGNKLDVRGKHLAVFNMIRTKEQWDGELPTVPTYFGMKLPKTIDEAIEQADGIKSLINSGRLAEGIVWKTFETVPCLGRNTFKVISNKWLLKDKS